MKLLFTHYCSNMFKERSCRQCLKCLSLLLLGNVENDSALARQAGNKQVVQDVQDEIETI